MSMTREEAIILFEKQLTAAQVVLDSGFGSNPGENNSLYRRRKEMAEIALSALRPVSRERVEKGWAGCEYCEKHKINLVRIEMNYNDSPGSPKRLNPTRVPKFCPICGRPLTVEAVEMVMERLEEVYGQASD